MAVALTSFSHGQLSEMIGPKQAYGVVTALLSVAQIYKNLYFFVNRKKDGFYCLWFNLLKYPYIVVTNVYKKVYFIVNYSFSLKIIKNSLIC